jgi:Rieske Fe-S protein
VREPQPPTARIATRRTVLLTGAGGIGAVALAACAAGGAAGGPKPSTKRDEPVAKLADVGVGTAIGATLADGAPVIVSRPAAGRVVCLSAICTHAGCTVAPSGTTLNCPCHGSQFDALTGKVLRGPATQPLPRIDVTVRNGEVVTT